MKIRWILILALILLLGTTVQTSVVMAAGSTCVSNNGEIRQQQDGSSCGTQVQGDRAIAINQSNAYALGDEFRYGPAEAFARNFSQARADLGSSAEATNESSAGAAFASEAYADDSSYASADNNSYAEATNDSSAIARTNSTAIATDGGCAYASGVANGGVTTAIAGSGETVVYVNGILQTGIPHFDSRYCFVWPR